jgi:AsmA protein
MNRTALRRAAIGTGVLLAVVLVAAAIFVATFDVNRYTPELVDAVHARTGRTLRFEGDLSLSLFPRLALKLPATTVSEPGREAVFARLQSGAASVALLPLLRGDIAVDAVRVEGLQATIVREKDGRTNIDDLLRPKREAGSGAKGGEPAATGGPTIGAVQLKNSNVTWRDLAAGRTVQFSGLDLRAGRYAAGARMPIDASANVSVNDPQLAARIELDADVEWNEQGGLRAIRGLALKGDGTLKKQPMALDAKAERLVLGADAIDVRGLRITASGKAADGAPIELKVDAPRIDVGAEKAGGERVEVSFSRRGAAPLEGKLHIEGLRGNAARLEAGAVKVSASSRSGDRTTRLDLSSALTASIKEKLVRFERAVGELAIEDPALAQRPLRLPVNASGHGRRCARDGGAAAGQPRRGAELPRQVHRSRLRETAHRFRHRRRPGRHRSLLSGPIGRCSCGRRDGGKARRKRGGPLRRARSTTNST